MSFKAFKGILLQLVLFFIILLSFNSCSSAIMSSGTDDSGIIDADNPNIQYIGRFDFSNPKTAAFDWAGVYICAKFEGTSCSVRLADYGNEYAVIIDNYAPRLLTTDTSTVYRIASGLPDSVPHSIMIQKRTEPLVGRGEFLGFILDEGKRLLTPDKRPERRIEFIGNSITSGYGVEGDSTGCTFSPQTENACMSYAAITARALNSDYHLVSFSGRGVVRNYGDPNKVSVDPMPALYNRTCFYDSALTWNFSKWVPQAVVINLGTNDFSTQPYPDKEVFQSAYTELINRIRKLYPNVTIFCICGPMIEEPCLGYIKEVVQQQQKNAGRYKDVFFIEIPRSKMLDTDWGCDWHPNVFGMNKIAEIIIPVIKLRMNW